MHCTAIVGQATVPACQGFTHFTHITLSFSSLETTSISLHCCCIVPALPRQLGLLSCQAYAVLPVAPLGFPFLHCQSTLFWSTLFSPARSPCALTRRFPPRRRHCRCYGSPPRSHAGRQQQQRQRHHGQNGNHLVSQGDLVAPVRAGGSEHFKLNRHCRIRQPSVAYTAAHGSGQPSRPQGLRLHDNPALLAAAKDADHLCPIFILDPWFLKPDKWAGVWCWCGLELEG